MRSKIKLYCDGFPLNREEVLVWKNIKNYVWSIILDSLPEFMYACLSVFRNVIVIKVKFANINWSLRHNCTSDFMFSNSIGHISNNNGLFRSTIWISYEGFVDPVSKSIVFNKLFWITDTQIKVVSYSITHNILRIDILIL